MARRYFGTDGVRGVAGEFLTADLVQRLGRAAVAWSGARARLRRPRHARLRASSSRRRSPRGSSRPARLRCSAACCRAARSRLRSLKHDLGVVITASHNPPEYNGVKFFRGEGKLSDADEEAIEALLDAPRGRDARNDRARRPTRADAYVDFVTRTFGSDLTRPRARGRLRERRLLRARGRRVRAARRNGARDRQRARRLEHQPRLRRHRHRAPAADGRRDGRCARARLRRRRRPSDRGRRARGGRRRRRDPRRSSRSTRASISSPSRR